MLLPRFSLKLPSICVLQKYEMIKTEEIPNLENSNFSTKVIKDIAQNILSFLKSNCTKEGHTYWLFKGEIILELVINLSDCWKMMFICSWVSLFVVFFFQQVAVI